MTRGGILSNLKAKIGPGIEVGDSDLNVFINGTWGYMVDEIIKANPDYFTKASSTAQVAGQQEYLLPTDFERMIMVNIQFGGVWRRALPFTGYINQVPVHEYTNSAQGYTTDLPKYYIYGNTPQIIGFLPIPTDTSLLSLKIWYVYTPSEFSTDGETPPIPARYHHLIRDGAYADYLDEDDEHQAAEAIRNRFEERVQTMCETLSQQQLDEPKSIIITNNYDLYVDQGFI